MTFNEILEVMRTWLKYKQNEYGSKITFEVVQNTSTCFRVIFETENSISELIVNEPDFAPYRWVSFQVMSVKKALKAEPVFRYYDNDSSTIQDIINELNIGVEVALNC